MKQIIYLMLGLLLLSACQIATEQKYTVEVYANPGLEFQGSIGGGGNTRSIQGVGTSQTPLIYEIEGWPAVAVIQKMQENGAVIVKIKDAKGNVLGQQSTEAAYGIVTVSSS